HRAKTPIALLSRNRLLDALLTAGIPADHLQPGGTDVVRREHDALAEMRREMRPGDLTGQRLEHDRMPFTRMGGFVFGIVDGAFLLAHRTTAFPRPIQDGGIIGDDLALLIVLMARLALWWQLHLHPVLDGDGGRIALPVALAL